MLRKVNFQKIKGKKVLLRVDFNCPTKDGKILDDLRIKSEIPFIKKLLKFKPILILISHLGRPKGEKIPELSLKSVKKRLEKYLKRKVKGPFEIEDLALLKELKNAKEKEIFLLENIRFWPEEEKGDLNFAKKLSLLGEIFINDAFSVCHRDHSSVTKITKFLPSFAGENLILEVKNLTKIMKSPKRPLVAIVGGAKIEDKAPVVEKFSKIADFVLVGELIKKAIFNKKIQVKIKNNVIFPLEDSNFDLGQKTIELFKEKIKLAKTVFWAGPLGKIEEKKYQKGTLEIAKAILKGDNFSVVGGGDTVEFLNKFSFLKKFDFVSLGGGAMLKFLSGEKLPGIEVLKICQK